MQGFQKVVGHQEIITHLQNAISMNKVSHAYLFGGESGSGKKKNFQLDIWKKKMEENQEQSIMGFGM